MRTQKKAQVTIFVIVAIVIVVLALVFYFFSPEIKSVLGVGSLTIPSDYLQSCMEKEIKDQTKLIASQGGVLEPEFYLLNKGEKLRYLCYSSQPYLQCVVQEPMLLETFEEEVRKAINEREKKCFDDLKKDYQRKGYDVQITNGETEVDMLPKNIMVTFNKKIVVSKEDTFSYDTTKIIVQNNNLYELISIANSIVQWETNYGDSETTLYMDYYPHIKVEKDKKTDGSTVYIITDRNTGDKFQFASRSVAWPAGYGMNEVLE